MPPRHVHQGQAGPSRAKVMTVSIGRWFVTVKRVSQSLTRNRKPRYILGLSGLYSRYPCSVWSEIRTFSTFLAT